MNKQEKELIQITEQFVLEADQEFSYGEVALKIDLLRAVVDFHKKRYYEKDAPIISDAKYDKLFRLLDKWEKDHPDLRIEQSPTQKVSKTIQSEFKKVKHLRPMLSLENAMDREELFEWEKRIRNILKTEGDFEYTVEAKLDGLAVSLLYEDDKLVRGATRGDGEVGEDITLNLSTIKAIPQKINLLKHGIKKAEIRGEVVMLKKEFQKLNQEREENGEQPFSNPRNAASGSMRQLDTSITASRKLSAMFFHLVSIEKNKEELHTELDIGKILKEMGFNERPYLKKAKSISEAGDLCEKLAQARDNFPFEIDGAVVKLNSIELRNQVGETSHHPRWAIAFKFKAKQETTRIKEVEWQVGRTGALTPVAHLEPVDIDGVRVARATLHNFDEVQRKGVKEGDMVIVERAGDVIPHIVAPIVEARLGNEREIKLPEKCPACGTKPVFIDGEVAIRCPNLSCPKQIEERLIHFCSKQGMDIQNLGEKVCVQLINKELVRDFADIFYLTKDDFMTLDLFKDKSSENAVEAIEEAKKRPLWRLIAGLGVRYVGKRTARALEKHFNSLEELSKASQEDFENIYDIGEKVAESLVKFFADENNQKTLERLRRAGVNMKNFIEKKENKEGISGKVFVFTGTLEHFKREEVKELVEKYGGKSTGSVSKNTDYLVAGSGAGSKKDKAEELGVRVISEEEFKKMIS